MTLLLSVFMTLAHLYLGWRLKHAVSVLSTGGSRLWSWFPVVVLISFYLLPVIGLLHLEIFGRVEMLEIFKPVMYWFWFGFIFSFSLLSWVLSIDILSFLIQSNFKMYRRLIRGVAAQVTLAVTVFLLGYTGIKIYKDTTTIITKRATLTVPDLPAALNGLKIVHISDVHGDEYTGRRKIGEYVDAVNRLNPDLVLFTGDLISYGTDYMSMAATELSKINSVYGTFAVVGDHDYWAGVPNIEPVLKKAGIPLLRNENKFINIDGGKLLLTGITQVYSKHADPDQVRQLTDDHKKTSFSILLSHQPAGWLIDRARKERYPLMVAGHTHGGQIRIPLFGRLFSASDRETSFISGFYRPGNILLDVNNGLGFTLGPVRFNAKPEVSLIVLKKASSS